MRSHWLYQQLSHVMLFTRQELVDRYRGKLFGVLWLLLQPLAYLVIFSVVFSGLMRAKLTGFEDQPYAYSIYLIAGLLIWTFMSNMLNQLVQVFQTKASLIRKVPMSLSLMPLYIPIAEGVSFWLSLVFFGAFLLFVGHSITLSWLLLPLIWGLIVLMLYGWGLSLALLSVFLPDIRTALPIFLQLLFWLTPIVYLPAVLPEWAQSFVFYNPFAWPVMASQQIVLYHQLPSFNLLLWMTSLAVVGLLSARFLQNKLEKDVRDLL